MEATMKIDEALRIMSGYDWHWCMADYGYTQFYEGAKATMRRFVKVVSEIENSAIREALRNLWTLKYENARAQRNGNEMEDFKEREAELMNVINS